MTLLHIFMVSIVGYLLGAINFAVIVARSKGVDILQFGSGNPGATNVTRAIGGNWGKLVFVLDASKGFVAAGWPLVFVSGYGVNLAILGLLASIVGHSFSVFLSFRGGKGVATGMGGLLAVMPSVLLIGVLLWGVVFFASRMVALASIIFAVSLPVSTFCLYGIEDVRFAMGLLLGPLIVIRHWSNIKRMLSGHENRFEP